MEGEAAAMNITLEENISSLVNDIDDYLDRFQTYVDDAMRQAAELVRDKLEEITPKLTGFTAASWVVISVGWGEFYITNSNEPVATFLSEGTAPHDIYPVSAEALHWVDESGEHFAKHVYHPGTEGLNLEETALAETSDDVDRLIAEAEERAWDEAMQ